MPICIFSQSQLNIRKIGSAQFINVIRIAIIFFGILMIRMLQDLASILEFFKTINLIILDPTDQILYVFSVTRKLYLSQAEYP